MSVNVVISQPMLFPWLGMVEQFLLADIFIFYDDVAFSKGSFTNRVQVKSGSSTSWLTIPVKKTLTGTAINKTVVVNQHWKKKHLKTLSQSYSHAPFCKAVIEIVRDVYQENHNVISNYAIKSMLAIMKYLDIDKKTEVYYSSNLGLGGTSSRRVFDIVRKFGGSNYITGHGARNYLDHHIFEEHNIEVSYMNYNITPYSQAGDSFTPYVSSLDAIATLGKNTLSVAKSTTVNWRAFING